MRYAIIENGVVVNVVEGGGVGIPSDTAGIGDLWDGEQFTRPTPPAARRIITRVEFLRRLGKPAGGAILTASNVSADLKYWLEMFRSAPEVDLDLQETIDGMAEIVAANIGVTQADSDRVFA